MKSIPILAAALMAIAPAAQAELLTFDTVFKPVAPVGGFTATGSGSATITFDTDSHDLHYFGSFTGLSGFTTQSHFHCCTAVAGVQPAGIAVDSPSLLGFPIGVQSGVFDATLDLDDAGNFNAGFLAANGGTTAGAINAFIAGVRAGKTYMNIHTDQDPNTPLVQGPFGGGEIFGFLQVPEPATYALFAIGLAGVAGSTRRRRTT